MLSVVTAVATEPLTLAEVKDYLRLGGTGETVADEDDDLLGRLITAAREKAEASLRIFFAAATYDYVAHTQASLIRLGRIGIDSIASVTLHADEGDATLSAGDWVERLKLDPPEIELKSNGDHYAVTVRFVTATWAIPQVVKLAMCYLIHHWYENREAWISTGAVPQTQPESYARIIHHYKRHRL